MVAEYAITRILGNELPPRDIAGLRLKALQHIARNEYLPENTPRLWLVNRILDDDYRKAVITILAEAKQSYIEEAIDWSEFIGAYPRDKRLQSLININKARNRCLAEGRCLAKFTFVLDGDCFFDQQSWETSQQFILADQASNPERRYYALPMQRLNIETLEPMSTGDERFEEPVIVFRQDAELSFDEMLPFGQDDKQDLLHRLGLHQSNQRWFMMNEDSACAVGGYVLHLQTGGHELDRDVGQRMAARAESLDGLLERADLKASIYLRNRNQFIKLFRFKMARWLGRLGFKAFTAKTVVKAILCSLSHR